VWKSRLNLPAQHATSEVVFSTSDTSDKIKKSRNKKNHAVATRLFPHAKLKCEHVEGITIRF
jgi:hypothetical protein